MEAWPSYRSLSLLGLLSLLLPLLVYVFHLDVLRLSQWRASLRPRLHARLRPSIARPALLLLVYSLHTFALFIYLIIPTSL